MSVLLPVWLFLWPSPAKDTSIPRSLVEPGELEQQYFNSCIIYSISALLELATEPFWLVFQLCLLVRERIALEAFANIVRASVVVFTVLFGPKSLGLYLLTGPQVTPMNLFFTSALPLTLLLIVVLFLIKLLHGSSLLVGYVILLAWLLKYKNKNSPAALLPVNCIADLSPSFSHVSASRVKHCYPHLS